jgi:uncharacterized protein (TIGR04141 family)
MAALKSRPLTVYLLKTSVQSIEDALEASDELQRHAVRAPTGTHAELFVTRTRSNPPRWVSFFDGRAEPDLVGLLSASSAGVLVMSAADRLFAIVFGHGRHLLRAGAWEESFGLRVTLNSLDPEKVRSLDRKTLEAVSRHTRDQASREIPIREFGLDIEKDLLNAAVGTPGDLTLGTRLAGADSLQATVKVDLDGLPALLERYVERWNATDYRERYPWVDNIAEVHDRSVMAMLDELLVERICSGTPDRVWLCVPEIIDWQDLGGFAMSTRRGRVLAPDIQLPMFLAHVEGQDLTIESLRKKKVHCFDASGDSVKYSWPVLQCAYGEIEHDGHVYVLNGGKWYRVHPHFVETLNDDIKHIPVSGLPFPDYSHADEAAYNAAFVAGNRKGFALLDRAPLTYGGGHSSIEICDILGKDNCFIHVKRYGGSQVLSHLFAQGAVAGELFMTDENFRVAVNGRLPRAFKRTRSRDRPASGEWRVIYCIITRSNEEQPTLPLFSRVNLRSAARRLRGLGLDVELAWARAVAQ